jgi:hypothetical protein
MNDVTRIRVKSKQPTPCCQPKHAGPILTDFADIVPNFTRVDSIVSEGFVNTVEPIQKLIATDPQGSRTIFEQGMDVNTAQAVLAGRIMCEHFEFIAVVSVETILSPEPDESLIVLYDLSNLGLGQALRGGEPREPDIVVLNGGNSYGLSPIATSLWGGSLRGARCA